LSIFIAKLLRIFQFIIICSHLGIRSAWTVVFICRLWWCWLNKSSNSRKLKKNETIIHRKDQINKYFITRPAYMSVELNAHNLLYLVFLVKQKQLPIQVLTNVHSFNSQGCESIFRDVRSLSGTFSTRINFTVKDFLQRSQKLCILNQMKHYQTDNNLLFPVHHKHRRDSKQSSTYAYDEIDSLDIEQLILAAYDEAKNMIKCSGVIETLSRFGIQTLNDLSAYVSNTLRKQSKMINYSLPTSVIDDEFGLDEEDDENNVENHQQDQTIDESFSNLQIEQVSDEEEEILCSTKSHFDGVRVLDEINPNIKQSYFKLKINEKIKYIHKQSSCWMLAHNVSRLSNDRLSRVRQQAAANF